jgi:hypothetical protein
MSLETRKPPARSARKARATAATRKKAARKPASPPSKKPWTIMIYMAGDNDLNSFCWKDLAELKSVGSSDALNIVVQIDTLRAKLTRRYYVTKKQTRQKDVVMTLKETDTGDPKVASAFFAWGIRNYPAERYLVGFWNHGSGIDETDVYAASRARGIPVSRAKARVVASHPVRRALFSTTRRQILGRRTRAIAYDDSAKDFLDNKELATVLANTAAAAGHPVDVLGLDACLMAMVELAYEMRDNAGVIVGSQQLEPGDGWPYHKVAGAIAANPSITGRELASRIVRDYVASYTDDSVTQSAVDTSAVAALARAVSELATALIAGLDDATLYRAIDRSVKAAQRFDTKDFVDLGSLAALLAKNAAGTPVAAAATRVLDQVRSPALIIAQGKKGTDVKGAEGVSIYMPQLEPDTEVDYGRLDFAHDTRWPDFLRAWAGR